MVNNKKTNEYFEKLQNIKLSEASRTRIQNNLINYAHFNSIHENVSIPGDSRSIIRVPQRTTLFNLIKSKPMTAAIIAIVLMISGGASYAAEGSVPGELLYTIKTDVNENIKSAFAISNKAEAKLQAQLAKERLNEAEELAVHGKLTAEVATDISSRLKAHSNSTEVYSSKVEAKGDFESSALIRADLAGSLRAYADILSSLNASVSGNNGTSLISDIRLYAEMNADAQMNAVATINASSGDIKINTEQIIARADNAIAKSTTQLEDARGKLTVEMYTQIENKLTEAISVQAEAKKSFGSGMYKSSYTDAQIALRISYEVETMINSALYIQIKTSTNISTDTNTLDINVNMESDTDTNVNTKASTDVGDTSNSNGGTPQDKNNTSSSLDINAEANTDMQIDGASIDANIKADTSVHDRLNF